MAKITSRKLSAAIVFASLYIVLAFVPIGTTVIGGTSSFGLAIIVPPVVGWILGPYYGALSMVISFAAGNFISMTATFGFLSVLISTSGAFFAGLNKRGFPFITAIYLVFFSFFFCIIYPTAWWYILPHIVASCCAVLILFFKKSSRLSVFFSTLSSTFAQQATGTFLSIFMLSLTSGEWYVIFPLTIYERTIASVGALLVILAIEKRVKTFLT
ncbi:MAG: hypothetical protein ABSB40_06325 [Nitrososphaeria archaeon]|jgi:hypothetical protein